MVIKFDAFLAGNYKLTPEEMAGFKLFDGKGNPLATANAPLGRMTIGFGVARVGNFQSVTTPRSQSISSAVPGMPR